MGWSFHSHTSSRKDRDPKRQFRVEIFWRFNGEEDVEGSISVGWRALLKNAMMWKKMNSKRRQILTVTRSRIRTTFQTGSCSPGRAQRTNRYVIKSRRTCNKKKQMVNTIQLIPHIQNTWAEIWHSEGSKPSTPTLNDSCLPVTFNVECPWWSSWNNKTITSFVTPLIQTNAQFWVKNHTDRLLSIFWLRVRAHIQNFIPGSFWVIIRFIDIRPNRLLEIAWFGIALFTLLIRLF